MSHEQLFRKISYTWRNSDFFNNIGGFLPFPICMARDAQTLKAVIYYRPLRSPCPRADAASVGIQRDVPVKIWWHLVMLGSDRLKRADTVSDTTIRMRSENRDSRQLHCLETVSPRRAGELRDRGLYEPVSAGPHWIRICGKHVSRKKMLHPGSRTYQIIAYHILTFFGLNREVIGRKRRRSA